MTIDVMDVVQTMGSLVSIVLIPIWKTMSDLRKGQAETNVILARDYVQKSECQNMHNKVHDDITRIHERIDDLQGK